MNIQGDLIIDTHILQYIFCQYNSKEEFKQMQPMGQFTKKICDRINEIIDDVEDFKVDNFVVASALAFIEIANKFEQISQKIGFNDEQFKAFVQQPPKWFLIEPLSWYCLQYLKYVPSQVKLKEKYERIEIADALHVATAMLRDGFLATHDAKLACIPDFKHRIIK